MDFEFRTLYVIDPYQGREKHTQISQVLLKLLSRLVPAFTDRWTLHTAITNLPKQTDNYSCGVFVAFYAMYWLQNRKFPSTKDFTQEQAPQMRLFMASRLSSAAKGGLHVLLQRNRLLPDMSGLPILLRNMFLDIPNSAFRLFLDKASSNNSGPSEVLFDSPPKSVRQRPVASPGGATASPQTKITRLNAKSSLMFTLLPPSKPFNMLSPSSASKKSRDTRLLDDDSQHARFLDLTASPQAKIAKVQHNIASPGAKSAVRRPILSHFFSPSRETAIKETADDTVSPVRRLNF